MSDRIEYIFSFFLKVFLLVAVFSFYGYFFIKIIDIFNAQVYLGTNITDILIAILSLIATYYTVKFTKTFFNNFQQGK
jgi:hypothetical protein